ncbi:ankyrin repeat-containing domain protein [Aspergillus lucknowensis]|uniref:Ankyrin repeat-containing domain protein n=1 Tax=Aspergillus lucknowensis TaxID=176173 RepID=A0ABR4L8F5_9EURO
MDGRVEITRLLLDQGANPNFVWKGRPLLFDAVEFDSICSLLLDRGANPRVGEAIASDESALSALGLEFGPLGYKIIEIGNPAAVRVLLERGFDFDLALPETGPEDYQRIPIQSLAGITESILDTFVQCGLPLPQPVGGRNAGKDALLVACNNGNVALLRYLVACGFNVRKPEWQMELLSAAADSSEEKEKAGAIVDALLGFGLDIDARDARGTTALSYNSALRAATASILIEQGADILAEDDFGVCPLDVACHIGEEETLNVFLGALDAQRTSTKAESLLRDAIAMHEEGSHAHKQLEHFYGRIVYPV